MQHCKPFEVYPALPPLQISYWLHYMGVVHSMYGISGMEQFLQSVVVMPLLLTNTKSMENNYEKVYGKFWYLLRWI